MKCTRCNGLMYRTELWDKRGYARFEAVVCMFCGEIVDPVIEGNRNKIGKRKTLRPSRAGRRKDRFASVSRGTSQSSPVSGSIAVSGMRA